MSTAKTSVERPAKRSKTTVSVLGPRVRVAEVVRRAVVEGVAHGTEIVGGIAVRSEARRAIVDAVIDELREVLELEGA